MGLVLAGLLAALVRFVVDHSYALYDDAYIYFRYADNLSAGYGFRYNPTDAPVEGFSSPLYLLLLAGARLVTADLESVSQILGVVFLAGALVAATVGGYLPTVSGSRRRSIALAASVALVLALDHFVLLNAVIGMETALGCLIITLVGISVLGGNDRGLRTLLVLAILTRPEALVFVPALVILPRFRGWRPWVPLALALAAVTAARWIIFEDLLPNTYWAKSGGTSRHLALGAKYLLTLVTDFPAILLAPLALLHAQIRRPAAYLLVGAALWLGFFLRSGGDVFAYSRLAVPLVPILTLLGMVGLVALVERVVSRWSPRIVGVSTPLVLVAALGIGTRAALGHGLAPTHGFANVKRWSLVGKYIAKHHPGAVIATVPIGAIGYYSRTRVLDLVGLTSRAVATAGRTVPASLLGRKWIGHERHNTEWILAQRPDLIVMTEWRSSPWVLARTRAGFYAEWLILRAIKEGRAPYRVLNAEIAPGVFWLMFARKSSAAGPATDVPAQPAGVTLPPPNRLK